MVQVERRVGTFYEVYDSYMVFEQKSFGKIVYDEYYGVNALGKARMKAQELNK